MAKRKPHSLMREMASTVAKRNKGKRRVTVGQIREDLKNLSVEVYKDPMKLVALLKNGERIQKRNRKRK